ncbi:uncharacterized protein LOC128225998 [Mya arenaria]|uniref:uncharacterized protein LOC128225998 n=1 Tax=Mya arenaria TaxID=6604 RepID=UPI0022E47985|nr:uncharacterized protein LOC128225998 [Mya arenaria]
MHSTKKTDKKRIRSSTGSELSEVEMAEVDTLVKNIENAGSAKKKDKQTKKKKIINEEETDACTSYTQIENKLDDINQKLNNMLTKNDRSFIQNIIMDTLDEIKDTLLKSVVHRVEILESELHETIVNDLEQYSRRNNIRITGDIKDSSGQTSHETAQQVLELFRTSMDIDIAMGEIDVAHRLGKYDEKKNRPIIVKFVCREVKSLVMRRAKLLKNSRKHVFINEDLTKLNNRVLSSLRIKDKSKVEKCWSFEGRIFAKFCDKERAIQLKYADFQTWLNLAWPNPKEAGTGDVAGRIDD